MEGALIYASFGVAFLAQTLISLPGPIGDLIPQWVPLTSLGIAILGAYHYMITLIEKLREDSKVYRHAPFPDIFQKWIEPYEDVPDVRIAAFTSTLYYQFVQANLVKMKRLRLLLFVEEAPRATCANMPFDEKQVVANWTFLVTAGQIEDLEIRRVYMNSLVYFSLAARDRGLVGFLWPNPDMQDIKAREALLLSAENSTETIIHLIEWFDRVWSQAEVLYP